MLEVDDSMLWVRDEAATCSEAGDGGWRASGQG
jgi:hypothetical protein